MTRKLRDDFVFTEDADGHRWGKFTAPDGPLGGGDWECCFNCGMVRRIDKQNSPCRGKVKVVPRNERTVDGE